MNKHFNPMPKMYAPLGARLIDGELYLLGGIGDFGDGEGGFNAADVVNALSEHGDGEIIVKINSPGGRASDGVAIYNLLKNHNGKVTIEVVGLAASAASLIAMAGEEIIMREGALMMIHEPNNFTIGDEAEHRRTAEQLSKIAEQAVAIYSARSKQKPASIRQMMKAETWMDGSEAVKLGFADSFHPSSESEKNKSILAIFEAAMSVPDFDYTEFKNLPETIRQAALRSGDKNGYPNKGLKMNIQTQPKEPKMRSKEMREYIKPFAARMGIDDNGIAQVIAAAKGDPQMARDELLGIAESMQPEPINNRHHGNPSDTTEKLKQISSALAEPFLKIKSTGSNPYSGIGLMGAMREAALLSGQALNSVSDRQLVASYFAGGSASMAHTASDFPYIIGNAADKIAMDAFIQSAPALEAVSTTKFVSNYRDQSMVRVGESPALQPVSENGNISHMTLGEEKQAVKLKSWGGIFTITQEAITNDDLSIFNEIQVFGNSASTTKRNEFYDILAANSFAGKTLFDGSPLFHTSRNNIASTPALLTVSSLSSAREAMRLQKGVDGKSNAGSAPAFLAVGPKLETMAEQILAEISATQITEVNPFSKKLQLLVVDEYDGFGWWLFADPAKRACLVHAYLNGVVGPEIKSRDAWEKRGVEFRATFDFGAGVADPRAAYFNAGVDPNE